MTAAMFRVEKRIEGAHPKHVDYPLLPGDLLSRDGDGTYEKEAPGYAVLGFRLAPEDEAALTPVQVERHGLAYRVVSES